MKEFTHYKELLEGEKKTLEGELSSIGRKNPSNGADWEAVPQETGTEPDPNDAADMISGFEDNTALLKDLEIRYNEVLAALVRITEGTYGVCSICGEDIEEERLEADPAATTCKEHI